MRRYDAILVALTVLLLVALGALGFAGTVYSYLASRADPEWSRGPGYLVYLWRMNAAAYPLVAGLLLVMGLCIPKRIVPARYLLPAGAALAAATSGVGLWRGATAGLAFLLGVSLLTQTAVVLLTLTRRGGLAFQKEGGLARLGSGLLHLGFVLFVLVAAVLEHLPATRALALPAFWTAAALMLGGIAMAFYPELTARLARGGRAEQNG